MSHYTELEAGEACKCAALPSAEQKQNLSVVCHKLCTAPCKWRCSSRLMGKDRYFSELERSYLHSAKFQMATVCR